MSSSAQQLCIDTTADPCFNTVVEIQNGSFPRRGNFEPIFDKSFHDSNFTGIVWLLEAVVSVRRAWGVLCLVGLVGLYSN